MSDETPVRKIVPPAVCPHCGWWICYCGQAVSTDWATTGRTPPEATLDDLL